MSGVRLTDHELLQGNIAEAPERAGLWRRDYYQKPPETKRV